MKIGQFIGKCRDESAAEAYTYWEELPPLPPGHRPAEDQVPPKQIITPATLKGLHRVYSIIGDDAMPNETATFWAIGTEPVCWLAQSGMLLQGRKAIKRVFGDQYDWERISAFDIAVDSVRSVLGRVNDGGKYLFATNDGHGWHVELSNDLDAMDKMREVLK